jgi:HEAT repeat protein
MVLLPAGVAPAAGDPAETTIAPQKKEPGFLDPARFGKILRRAPADRLVPHKLIESVVANVTLDGEAALVEPTLSLAADSLADLFRERKKGPITLLEELPDACRRREKELASREDEEFVPVTNHAKWPSVMARLSRILRRDPLLWMLEDWSASDKDRDTDTLVALARKKIRSHSGKERRAAARILVPFMNRPEIARLVIDEEIWFVEHGHPVNRDVLRAMHRNRDALDARQARRLLTYVLTTPRQHATQPRTVSAIILGCMEDRSSLPTLLEQLNHPQVDAGSRFVKEYHQPHSLREGLCFAVAKIGDASAFDTLVANLRYRGPQRKPFDREASVRAAAAMGLAKIGDPRAVLPLCNLLSVETNEAVARVARAAAEELAGKKLLPDVRTGLTVAVPDAPRAGRPLTVTVRGPSKEGDGKLQGAVHWRPAGGEAFKEASLAATDDVLSAELQPAADTEKIELYVEVRRDKGPAVRLPQARPGEAPAVVALDTARPELPEAPKAVDVTSHTVTLRWPAARDDTEVAGYRIYRAAPDASLLEEQNLVASPDASQREWTDRPQPGREFAYAVVPVDRSGRAGEPGKVQVKVPSDTAPQGRLALRTCVREAKELVLLWSGPMAPDVSQIEIERAEGKGGEFRKVKTLTRKAGEDVSRWTDSDVRPGVTYRYRLRLRDKAGHVGAFGDVVRGRLGDYARRINCGGYEVVGEDETLWEADRGAIRWSAAYRLDRPVQGAGRVPQQVYRIERWSSRDLEYVFEGVPPGEYEVILHFAESNDHVIREGARLFDVAINGRTVAAGVDVYRRAGGGLRAWQLADRTRPNEGAIKIRLEKVRMGPAIKGIEVHPGN